MTLIFLSNLVQLRADPENESEALERGREKRDIFMGEIKVLQAPALSARPEVFIILGVTDTLTRLSQITDKLRN